MTNQGDPCLAHDKEGNHCTGTYVKQATKGCRKCGSWRLVCDTCGKFISKQKIIKSKPMQGTQIIRRNKK